MGKLGKRRSYDDTHTTQMFVSFVIFVVCSHIPILPDAIPLPLLFYTYLRYYPSEELMRRGEKSEMERSYSSEISRQHLVWGRR